MSGFIIGTEVKGDASNNPGSLKPAQPGDVVLGTPPPLPLLLPGGNKLLLLIVKASLLSIELISTAVFLVWLLLRSGSLGTGCVLWDADSSV